LSASSNLLAQQQLKPPRRRIEISDRFRPVEIKRFIELAIAKRQLL
jgi:hypothetical protein